MRNVNTIFRKNVSYDNIKSHKKSGLYPFSSKYRGVKLIPSLFRVNGRKNRVPMPPKIPLKSLGKKKILKILKNPKILAFHSDIS